MTVVDIRNVVTDSSVELIEISDRYIYYAEEKSEEGYRSLFILEYDRLTKTERILSNYILNNPTYVQHYYAFPNDILLVMENSGSVAWILRVDKKTGREKDMAQIGFVGNFSGCTALDESHLLFSTERSEEHSELFDDYQRLTGFSRVTYLYDLNDQVYYYVRDGRICDLEPGNLIVYDSGGQSQLLILHPHGSETEKARCYENRRWLGDDVSDIVWRCPLLDFLVGVKASQEELPLELMLRAGTDGLVRFAGKDENNLYFRVKYFPENDQRICAVDKQTGKTAVAAELNLRPGEAAAKFFIDTDAAKAYRVVEQEDGYEIFGVLNSNVEGKYSRELGEFIACVEDRFVVARYIISDEKDAFEFNSVYDLRTARQESYECRCAVKGETVVLY